MPLDPLLDDARARDAADPLRHLQHRFHLPQRADGGPQLYFAGHSLGPMPADAPRYVEDLLNDWAHFGVAGHHHAGRPWIPYHTRVAEGLAELVGAHPDEVVAMNTLTANLHLMMASFYQPQGRRTKILMEPHSFPSDRYAVVSQLRWHGLDPEEHLLEPQAEHGRALDPTELETLLDRHGDEIALVLLAGVQYGTGQRFNMPHLTQRAQAKGCMVGLDLAHAIGNVPLALNAWNVDFAVWCTYKYLNSGPGAVAGAFVHRNHHGTDLPRLAGWWGHNADSRFAMGPEFVPMPGAEGWQLSNPPILSLAPLEPSLQLFHEAGMDRLRAKSLALTGWMAELLAQMPEVEILTPLDPEQRGAMLCFRIEGAGKAVYRHLLANGVACDWREPGTIRATPAPLYTGYETVYHFIQALKAALHEAAA